MKTVKMRIFPAILAVVLVFSCFGAVTSAVENGYTDQFNYYVDGALQKGFVPDRMKNNLGEIMNFGDAIEFQLQFIKAKCGVDVDTVLDRARATYSDGDAIAATINELMGRPLYSVNMGDAWNTEQPPIYAIFFGFTSVMHEYLAPLPPLIYDRYNSAYVSRYNFQNGSPVVYHDDVIFSLLSEIIGLSQGVARSEYNFDDMLTRRQFAAFCYMLSTMSLPKDTGGKYHGGVSGNAMVDGFVASILDSAITPGMSSRDKVKAIYDYMIYNFVHDDNAMPIIALGDDSGIGNPLADAVEYALPIIMTKNGTCDVFANVFRLLALRLGFECNYVSGQYVNGNGSKTGHGWNQIKVDDEWYWVDVDVEGSVFRRDGLSQPLYFLFMKKDGEWTSNHQWERAQWPTCDSTKHSVGLEEHSITAPLMQQRVRTARPTTSTIFVNGKQVSFDAYNINDNNYFKLRDLAHILSGTEKQFEVGWNGGTNTITLTSGRPYTPVGGEMAGKGTENKTARGTTSKILLDGRDVSFTAYNIENNNYFKLRDIGEALDFGVDWEVESQTIVIDTSRGYTPE
jgi:hypothetical protein